MIFQINNEEKDYKLEAYDYFLDPSLIASKPSAIRHESRLMIVRNSALEENCLINKFTKNLLDELKKRLGEKEITLQLTSRLLKKITDCLLYTSPSPRDLP